MRGSGPPPVRGPFALLPHIALFLILATFTLIHREP